MFKSPHRIPGRLLAALLLCSLAALPAAAAERYLRVAYFVPADRQPAERYTERLQRLLEDIRRYYREEMQANGHPPLTFELDKDARGRLRIHEIRGKEGAAAYPRHAEAKVAEETRQALARQGLNMDDEAVIVFQRLMEWKDGKIVETGPYKGGGSGGRGIAYVYDDAHLDAALLTSDEPAGYCLVKHCTWGEFNNLYIGGIAHELGHLFGLPHLAETRAQRERYGLSLMGAGNRAYRCNLRGVAPTSFLAPASALALIRQPLFRQAANVSGVGNFRLSRLNFRNTREGLRITGQVVGPTPALGIVARNDDQAIADDYDAVGWSTQVAGDGGFELLVGDLAAGRYQLTLTVVGDDGRFRHARFDYGVDKQRGADLAALQQAALLAEAGAAFAEGDRPRLRELLADPRAASPGDAQAKTSHLLRLLDNPPTVDIQRLGAEQKSVDLARLTFSQARTGYGPPLRDQVLQEGGLPALLEVGRQFYPSGLYAHAPALHEVAVNGEWRRLRTGYGLQDGHNGSVVFVVRGDGRELFRSPPVRDHEPRFLEVDLAGVKSLQLLTENAGDGNAGDWGVWLRPTLER